MSQTRFLPALTGLRGVCAVWVLAFHSHDFLPPQDIPIIARGWMGVDVFFILSGFIISHVHISEFRTLRTSTILRFYAIRISRIYPVHVVTMLLALFYLSMRYLIGAPVSASRFSLLSLLQNVFLIQSWNADRLTWNYVSWSISAEWAVYLSFPMIASIVSRLMSPSLAIIGFVISIVTMSLVLSMSGFEYTSTPLRFALVRAFGGFVAGCFLNSVYRRGSLERLPWGKITVSATLAIIWISYNSVATFGAIPIIGILVLGLAYGKGLVARFLSTPEVMFVGQVSYSLYMVHFLVLEIVFAPVQLTRLAILGGGVLYPTYVLGLICVSVTTILVFHFIEKPGRLTMRDFLLSRLSAGTA